MVTGEKQPGSYGPYTAATRSFVAWTTYGRAIKTVCSLLPVPSHKQRKRENQANYASTTANVNWLINSCQNIGYYSVFDPGPPDLAYVCSHTNDLKQGHTCPRQTVVANSNADNDDDGGDDEGGGVGVLGIDPTVDGPAIAEQPTRTTPETTQFKTHHASSTHDPSSAGIIHLSGPADRYNRQNDIPAHVKVAIALATLAGIALMVTFFLCLRRARRATRKIEQREPHDDAKSCATPSYPGSPVALGGKDDFPAESGSACNKSPPPRLQNRRLLSSLPLSPGPKPYSNMTKPLLGGLPPVPASPHKGDPQQQQHVTRTFQTIPSSEEHLGAMTPAAPKACKLRIESSNSYASITTTSSSPSWTLALSSRGSTGTGTWPPGHHRPKGSIPGSPGPPPDRALPSTPPKSPTVAVQRPEGIGVAVGHPTPTSNSLYHGVRPSHGSHELCGFSDAYAPEPSYSPGIWKGAGDGGANAGARALPPRKMLHGVRTPLLGETGLEETGRRS
jgi:hypothetical protein